MHAPALGLGHPVALRSEHWAEADSALVLAPAVASLGFRGWDEEVSKVSPISATLSSHVAHGGPGASLPGF